MSFLSRTLLGLNKHRHRLLLMRSLSSVIIKSTKRQPPMSLIDKIYVLITSYLFLEDAYTLCFSFTNLLHHKFFTYNSNEPCIKPSKKLTFDVVIQYNGNRIQRKSLGYFSRHNTFLTSCGSHISKHP